MALLGVFSFSAAQAGEIKRQTTVIDDSLIMAKLKIYSGAEHPHEAQQPEIFDIASKNKKNKR